MSECLFEEIQKTCTEKKVISLCKKLQKKCSFKSGTDVRNLTELAYWLYVYKHQDEAMKICQLSHIEIPQPLKIDYRVWDFILYIWGLEAFIYRDQNNENKSKERIELMNKVWSIPNTPIADTVEKQKVSIEKIRSRLTFDDAIRKEEIDRCENKSSADNWRFTALFKMIGYGVTGFYPQLEENKKELQKKIEEYIVILTLK